MRALMPEVEKVAACSAGRRQPALTMAAVAALLGGYRGPHWSIDRRPQPLRGRKSADRVRTLLRRRAVTRLRMEGLSFRRIGRELGISQVAAWKLWRQVMRDVIEVGQAERLGWARLHEAKLRQDAGDGLAALLLLEEAVLGFGPRAMSTLREAKGPRHLQDVFQYG